MYRASLRSAHRTPVFAGGIPPRLGHDAAVTVGRALRDGYAAAIAAVEAPRRTFYYPRRPFKPSMSIWGKIVGGATGFAIGGPLGALIGTAVGHGVDRIAEDAVAIEASANGAADDADGPDHTRKIAFTIGVIALGAKMAKADGRVTRNEVTAFRQVFRVPPGELDNVGRVFNLARRDSAGFEPYARQIARMFHDRPAVLEELLLCLFHIAQADGTMNEAETAFLRAVARIFGLSDAEFERIRAEEAGPDAADPYNILGIERGADDGAVKAAWRRLVREQHPDRLIAQGLPQEFVAVANQKLASVNAAYDRIARERGMR